MSRSPCHLPPLCTKRLLNIWLTADSTKLEVIGSPRRGATHVACSAVECTDATQGQIRASHSIDEALRWAVAPFGRNQIVSRHPR